MTRVVNQGESFGVVPDEAKTIAEMNKLVEKYTTNFPLHSAVDYSPPTEVVLLTGSTGGLGSYILEALVLNSSISRIYALNRRGNQKSTSHERQRRAFEDRGIDLVILESPKIVFLEGDANLDLLGLSTSVYEQLRTCLSCIIHSGTSLGPLETT